MNRGIKHQENQTKSEKESIRKITFHKPLKSQCPKQGVGPFKAKREERVQNSKRLKLD